MSCAHSGCSRKAAPLAPSKKSHEPRVDFDPAGVRLAREVFEEVEGLVALGDGLREAFALPVDLADHPFDEQDDGVDPRALALLDEPAHLLDVLPTSGGCAHSARTSRRCASSARARRRPSSRSRRHGQNRATHIRSAALPARDSWRLFFIPCVQSFSSSCSSPLRCGCYVASPSLTVISDASGRGVFVAADSPSERNTPRRAQRLMKSPPLIAQAASVAAKTPQCRPSGLMTARIAAVQKATPRPQSIRSVSVSRRISRRISGLKSLTTGPHNPGGRQRRVELAQGLDLLRRVR